MNFKFFFQLINFNNFIINPILILNNILNINKNFNNNKIFNKSNLYFENCQFINIINGSLIIIN